MFDLSSIAARNIRPTTFDVNFRFGPTRRLTPDKSDYRTCDSGLISTCPITALIRSWARPGETLLPKVISKHWPTLQD
jgi:hypothetical protein